jgi:hypothetical protein
LLRFAPIEIKFPVTFTNGHLSDFSDIEFSHSIANTLPQLKQMPMGTSPHIFSRRVFSSTYR